MLNRFASVLFWSIIAAAFIGPGTVTTAAAAGAGYGFRLLWALSFSTIACLVLQESSARLTIVSGRNLGQALKEQYHGSPKGVAVLTLVLGAIVLGCAAYQAGNILGGTAGAALGVPLSRSILTLIIGLAAGGLLTLGAPGTIARILGGLVAVMGVAFLVTAWGLHPPPGELLRGLALPSFPAGSGLLILGLVGTTVVPYNLFLGSGLARGQSLGELRFGLTVAVLAGGLISMAVVVAGTAVVGPFSFEKLADVLEGRLGSWARTLFGLGLFSAGLSSAVTAPLAAAITARGVFGGRNGEGWGDRSWRFRSVWLGVLTVGVGFGLAETPPVPAILVAQALNGVLLPLVAVFLLLAVNDRRLMGPMGLNGWTANTALSIIVALTLVLGLTNVAKAVARTLSVPLPAETRLLFAAAVVAAGLAWPVGRAVSNRRRLPSNVVKGTTGAGSQPS